MQYTIRNVPSFLDAALRVSAQERGKSLNEVAIEALARGFGLSQAQVRQRDLSDIAGSWRKDPACNFNDPMTAGYGQVQTNGKRKR